jgi:Flp pilus assembly protein TadG
MKLFKAARPFKSIKRDERGNISVITAILAAVLVSALAVSIDISNGVNNKSRLSDASDAVSLMLAKSELTSDADMKRAAQTYLDSLYPGTQGARLEILNIIRDGDAVTVQLSDVSDAEFSGVLNCNTIQTSASSTAVFSRRSLDIALVLDSTGSMSGSKMTTLKTAATDMVDTIDGNSDSNVRMSVTPFSNYVNVGMSQRGQNWLQVQPDAAGRTWRGCVGSRSTPHNTRAAYNGRRVPAHTIIRLAVGSKFSP